MKKERDSGEDLAYAYGLLGYYCTVCGKKFDSRITTEGEAIEHVVVYHQAFKASSIRTAGGGGVRTPRGGGG